eukprot:1357716-Amorphochlora_amoeboformis.AAC.1
MGYTFAARALMEMGAPLDLIDPLDTTKSNITPLILAAGGALIDLDGKRYNSSIKLRTDWYFRGKHERRATLFKAYGEIASMLTDKSGNTALTWAANR